jgi:Peptidase MA superfamily
MLTALLLALAVDSLAIRVGNVTVIAPPAQRGLAVALAEEAERAVEWPGIGRRTPPPFTLVVTADSAGLARVTRGRAPGWGAGVAFPGARTIILRADLPDLAQTLRHELAHLALRTAVRVRVPLWFDEGYAAWATGELGRAQSLELNLAVAAGRIPSLTELDGMLRGSASTADLAYALAASAVAEVSLRQPPGAMDRLIARLSAGEDFDAALTDATGLSPDRFEEAWQRSLRQRYSLMTWLAAGGMWALIAFSLGGLAWYRREQDRPRRAALDQGWVVPPPEPPDEGPPAPVETVSGAAPEGPPVDRRGLSQ